MLSLLSAGSNAQGQLGNGTTDDSHVFQACSFAGALPGTLPSNTSNVIDVTNGANHSVVLLELVTPDGLTNTEIWGCGDGRKGQLGPNYRQRSTDEEYVTMFQKLALDNQLNALGLEGCTVKGIGATWETSYAVVAKSGKQDVIVSFGSNDFGDLGIGKDAEERAGGEGEGVHIVDFSHVTVDGHAIKSAGSITVEKLRTGQRHVIACLNIVWADERFVQVLVGWGSCRHGQLGDSPAPHPSSKRPISSKNAKKPPASSRLTYHSRPILVWASSSSSTRDLIIEYSLGIHHSVFLNASGRLSAIGSNRKNQIQGLDDTQNIRDIKCTWNGTYMLTVDEPTKILSTGSNSHGQLGRTDDVHNMRVVGVPVGGGIRIKALACGSEHSLVCLSVDRMGDEVWGWGWNEHGNLGLGNTSDSPIPQRIWPQQNERNSSAGHLVRSIWGGNGSSWILCKKSEGVDERSS